LPILKILSAAILFFINLGADKNSTFLNYICRKIFKGNFSTDRFWSLKNIGCLQPDEIQFHAMTTKKKSLHFDIERLYQRKIERIQTAK